MHDRDDDYIGDGDGTDYDELSDWCAMVRLAQSLNVACCAGFFSRARVGSKGVCSDSS